MTDGSLGSLRILGTLGVIHGRGVIRLEDRFSTDRDDLWSALTDPRRLSRWLGKVEGELQEGGDFRARYFASGWEGVCHVEECSPPASLRLLTSASGEPDGVVEVRLTADSEQTVLVLEDRGVPIDEIASYGAGDQIHMEDLAAYLAGREPCDARERWRQLHPAYQLLSANLE